MPDQPSKESLGMSQPPYQARNIDIAESGGQPAAQMSSDFNAPMELVASSEIEQLRQQNAALVEALRSVMKYVYADNDFSSRDYENYYAAVDAAWVAVAPYAPAEEAQEDRDSKET